LPLAVGPAMSASGGSEAALPGELLVLIARILADTAAVSSSEDVVHRLKQRGILAAESGWGAGSGIQLTAEGNDAASLAKALDAWFSPSDLLIADHEPKIPGVFISDMDSTMIMAECIDELADFVGIKPQIAAITERAMLGELDFETALRERVGLLRGMSEGAIAECLASRIAMMPGAQVLVQTLKAKGCRTILVTGGFHQFADPVAAELGFERVVANRLEIADGKLTGGLLGPIVDSSVKRAVLIEEAALLGSGTVTLATGDGANDIPMLEAATYGIAFAAKPIARAAANGWIDRGNLTGVLDLLGIPPTDWVWE
jgi:phosphoserine phosphatase